MWVAEGGRYLGLVGGKVESRRVGGTWDLLKVSFLRPSFLGHMFYNETGYISPEKKLENG